MRSIELDEVLIWRTSTAASPSGPLPNFTKFSNPLVWGNLVLVSCFSEQKVVAYNKGDGRERWTFPLGRYAGAYVSVSGKNVVASTTCELFCLDLSSGQRVWKYAPFEGENEHAYSGTLVQGGRVFWGDTYGMLHCLEAKTGKAIWKAQIGQHSQSRVNAPPVVTGGIAYVVNNEGLFSARSVRDGSEVWQTKLADGALTQPILFGNQVIVQEEKALSFVNVKTKKVRRVTTMFLHDFAVLGKKIVCVGRRQRETNEDTKYYRFEIRKGRVANRSALGGAPTNLVPLPDGRHLCISQIGQVEILSRKSMKTVFRMPGYFGGVPSFQGLRMYISGENSEAICLKLHLSSK